jgi:hypothetical protein
MDRLLSLQSILMSAMPTYTICAGITWHKEMPMRRTLLIAGLLFVCSVPLAQTLTQIEYPIYGAGGGKSSAATHSVNVAIGQAVVGRSTAASHSLLHGPWPYRSGNPTDVPEEQVPENQIPAVQALQLRPNVPNPFNPGTEIRYDVPTAAGPVSVHVYDRCNARAQKRDVERLG